MSTVEKMDPNLPNLSFLLFFFRGQQALISWGEKHALAFSDLYDVHMILYKKNTSNIPLIIIIELCKTHNVSFSITI